MNQFRTIDIQKNIVKLSLVTLSFFIFMSLPVGTGDTYELILGSANFDQCIFQIQNESCLALERFGFTPHLISFLLLHIYPNPDVVIVLWSLINFVSFLFITYMVFNYTFNRYPVNKDSFIFLSGMIFSPMIAYAVYSFSEMTYIFISILFLNFLIKNNFIYAALFGILAISYKDNSFLVILPLAIFMLVTLKFKLRKSALWILPLLLGLGINAYFNFVRYGTLTNAVYQEEGTIFSFSVNLNNFLALWVSPSGGVLGYLFLLPVLVLIYLLKLLISAHNVKKLPIVMLILPVLFVTLNLSFWYSPFGWVAWGPRLILPALIIFLFISFVFLKESNLVLTQNWKIWQTRLFFSVTLVSLFMSLGFLKNPGIWSSWYEKMVENNVACPTIPVWENDPNSFLDCNFNLMWNLYSLPYNSIIEFFNFLNIGSQSLVLYFFNLIGTIIVIMPFIYYLIFPQQFTKTADSSTRKFV